MKKWYFVIGAVAAVFLCLLFFIAPEEVDIPGLKLHTPYIENNQNPKSFNNLWFDYGDIIVYYQRSGWVEAHQFPYSYTDQEYPPLGLLYFSLPRLFSTDIPGYVYGYVLLAAVTFVGLLACTWKLLHELGKSRWYMLGFALPSFLYFIVSRFDVFAATVVMVALFLLYRKKFIASMVIIGIAMLIKWYPIFLVPFAVAWALRQGITKQVITKGVVWGSGIFLGVTAITVAMSGVRAGFPYAFHVMRGIEMGSLPSVVLKIVSASQVPLQSEVLIIFMGLLLFGVQLLPFIYGTLFYSRMRQRVISFDHFLRFSLLAVIIFVHIGKIYSPQWEVWWLPLALLVIRKRSEWMLLIAIDILNYVLFPLIPIIFNTATWFRYAYFDGVVIVHAALLLVFSMSVARPLFSKRQHIEAEGNSAVF